MKEQGKYKEALAELEEARRLNLADKEEEMNLLEDQIREPSA